MISRVKVLFGLFFSLISLTCVGPENHSPLYISVFKCRCKINLSRKICSLRLLQVPKNIYVVALENFTSNASHMPKIEGHYAASNPDKPAHPAMERVPGIHSRALGQGSHWHPGMLSRPQLGSPYSNLTIYI